MRELLKQVDGLLPNSCQNCNHCETICSGTETFEIAHYGVDPKLFLDADPEPFRKQTGIQGPFVLQAGRTNYLRINNAVLGFKDTSLPIVPSGVVNIGPPMQICAAK